MNNEVRTYLASIGKIPVLDHDTLYECFESLNNDGTSDTRKERIRELLIISNLKLVVSIAKKYKSSSELPLLDIIQEGNCGLMTAVSRYNHKRGCKFSTYATWWIRQAISMHISKNRKTIRLPNHILSVKRRIADVVHEFRRNMGNEPTFEELSDMLPDVSPTVLKAAVDSAGTIMIPIHTVPQQGSNPSRHDVEKDGNFRISQRLSVDSEVDPFELLSSVEMFKIVSGVMDELTVREQAVIRMRFGLYDAGINREDYICEESDCGPDI